MFPIQKIYVFLQFLCRKAHDRTFLMAKMI